MARLSMHMLDTIRGEGAAGIRVDFSKLEGGSYKLVRTITTNEAGRTAEPLMTGDAMLTGNFMLEFFHAVYFKARAYPPAPPFFDRVTHFFSIPAKMTAYHITMVAAPWGYTTYRWKE